MSNPVSNENRFTSKKCHKCGETTSILAARTQNERFELLGWHYAYVTAAGIKYPLVDGRLRISCRGCGTKVQAAMVHGVFKAARKCDAKCLDAKGHKCECSCGGKNHGAGYETTAAV